MRIVIASLALLGTGTIAWGGCGEGAPTAPESRPGQSEAVRYVGGAACAGCHGEQAGLWKGSHHDLAMQVARPETVLGDFADASLEHRGQRFDFETRDGRFFVRTAGVDGAVQDFEVTHTFGVAPLQQYLVPLPGGRRQVLGVAWDARPEAEGGQRWFHLHPGEAVPPGDVLHWTGPAGSWNTLCADCHSTNLAKGYRVDTASYETTWSEIDVSCEACHGPGSAHVAWAENGVASDDPARGLQVELGATREWSFSDASPIAKRTPAEVPGTEVETCAPCHARRSRIAVGTDSGGRFLDAYRPALLEEGLYYADGQILDEVYVWGSFLQSRMHAKGVSCSDCHDPHRLEIAKPDATCAGCHRSEVFAAPSHHHHAPDSAGASCVACHMPEQTYMVVDARRDHSFRVPRPDLSEAIGVPNACSRCHAGQSAAWAAEATALWYGPARSSPRHYGEALEAGRRRAPGASGDLAALVEDEAQPALVRATALQLLGTQLTPRVLPALVAGLTDRNPLVRMAAAGAAEAMPPGDRARALAPLLRDEVRAVRIEAGRGLASVAREIRDPALREALAEALAEYRVAQAVNADQPAAHVNLAILHTRLGDLGAAEHDYREALRVGPSFLPAYLNLADLHRMRGDETAGERILRRALDRFPESADVHHALGLLWVRSRRMEPALAALARAAQLAPESPRYAYVHAVALSSAGEPQRALAVLEEAHRAHPAEPDILVALATLFRDVGDRERALVHARKLSELRPEDPGAQSLLLELESAPARRVLPGQ